MIKRVDPIQFFGLLQWIDGTPLMDHVEPYRQRIFRDVLFDLDADGHPRKNLFLGGRAKKGWKSADLILAALYRLCAWESPGGNQCYILANDEGQAGDDLDLAKKIVKMNRALQADVTVKQKTIERRDDKGFLQILPAKDIAGSHGKTYLFAGFDEIHEYRTWDLLEAMQLDPTRLDALMWITSYASLYHKPGGPLFDLCRMGWMGQDPRMLFSWYAADRTTDPDFEYCDPETRANPSRSSWADPQYLDQQRSRLPSHKFRRLHLNLPGLPEGAPYQPEIVMDAIARGVRVRRREEGVQYAAFVDMSGGSNDDAVLGIGYRDADGRAVLARLVDQGQPPPFDPRKAVARFAAVLKELGIFTVEGDKYAGETFVQDFGSHGISYQVCECTKSQLYEALEPRLNSRDVILLDEPKLEQQLLGLLWRGGKIDHLPGEHDDYANAAAGVVHRVAAGINPDARPEAVGSRTAYLGAERAADEYQPWYERTSNQGGTPAMVRVRLDMDW